MAAESGSNDSPLYDIAKEDIGSDESAWKHSTLEVMGRTGYVYRPRSLLSPSAAILVLHGSGGVATDMFDLGFEERADLRNFLVVYPEMLLPHADEWGYNDDIPYFAALAQRLQESDFGVPASQLYICGHSAGGTMVTFVQNQMDDFSAAGVVEAAPGSLDLWTMSRRGKPTIVVWNHADPVLAEYGPGGSEAAYYNLTVDTLRRNKGAVPDAREQLPVGDTVVQAERLTFKENAVVPELQIISWTTAPGKHAWALPKWTKSLDATERLIDFFFAPRGQTLVV